MKFSVSQNETFGTAEGAYSYVTQREFRDSQITLTDHESELVLNYFGMNNIQVGNVGSNPQLSSKQFRLYPSGALINLNLNYPKPGKAELRLYISQRAGFKPLANNVCFIFVRNNDIWIGEMTEIEWRLQASFFKDDDDDDVYQKSINNEKVRVAILPERVAYARDKRIARQRFELSQYRCEFNPMHDLFISRSTGFSYLEAHHLIPMKAQGFFPNTLDTIDNIFALCPYCHRAIHHAEPHLARSILDKLVYQRPVIQNYGLVKDDLYQLYSVEEIL